MSWFRRKPKNRRLGNDHVLDVKLRSDRVRANRMRYAAIAIGLAFVTVFCFYLAWNFSSWALNRLVYENSAFAIQDIDVHTDGVIAPEALRRWSGVKLGQNLFALDLARVKRDLELASQVRSAAVERVLPHTLRLRVLEREPLAQVYAQQPRPDGTYQWNLLRLDRDGFVIAPLDSRQRGAPAGLAEAALPVLTGANAGLMTPGRRIESQQVLAALKLLDAFGKCPLSGPLDISAVDVSLPDVLVARTTQGGKVTLGLREFDTQLRHWKAIYDFALRSGKAVATLDLSVTNNSPATWLVAGP